MDAKVKAVLAQHPDWGRRRIAAEINDDDVTAGRVAKALVRVRRGNTAAGTAKPRPRHSSSVITEADLLLDTDLETKAASTLRRELTALEERQYIKDYDLRKECGCTGDPTTWRAVTQTAEFAKHVMEIGSNSNPTVYWGCARSVTSMVERHKARRPAWAQSAKER